MRHIIFILLALCCIKTNAEITLFEQANREYKNENYSQAINLYNNIITNNMESSEIYYNLGNCYYKQKEWANAIWNYEKSLQLKKNKKTLQNLELTQLRIIDKIELIPELFYTRWWKNTVDLFTTKTWQIFLLAIIWIICILEIINKLISYKRKNLIIFLSIITIILSFINYSSYTRNHTNKKAIIFASTVTVKSAPTTNSKNLFSLHSGTKISIIDNVEDWINIQISDGKSGWIKKSTCKSIQ